MVQKVVVGKSLAQAFLGDPFYRAITVDFTDDEQKTAVLARYFELAIDEALDIGEVVCSDTCAAAIWLTNEADAAVANASSRARDRAIAELLGESGFNSFNRIVASMAGTVPPRLHEAWYLSILGVHPNAQGKGIASALLAPTLRRADDLGITCFLETFNPSSLPFYERAGFRETIPCFEEITDRPYWIVIRQPSTQAAA